ncbi:MAG: GNAT family N-acetyltransferase [Asgard group archaeon]|nr:GNAT family N-acetyltransferase [Asgard group archaeon]
MKNEHLIQLLQEISANAWPAKQIHLVNGWFVRLSEGVTRRANSVLPLSYYGYNTAKDIEFVEELYSSWNLPVIFQIPDYFEPEDLVLTLKKKGYKEEAESVVMAGAIEEIKTLSQNQSFNYFNTSKETIEWIEALQQLNNSSDERIANYKQIIKRINQPKEYFTATLNDNIVGVGLAVTERSHLGLYSMVTHPDYRRKGIARSMIAEMVKWAKQQGITTFYLQVQGDNSGAIALYKSVYLSECYRYRYLVKK